MSEAPPTWLKPASPGDNFHYGPRPLSEEGEDLDLGGLVIFPTYHGKDRATLDGNFSSAELRDIADWIDRSMEMQG